MLDLSSYTVIDKARIRPNETYRLILFIDAGTNGFYFWDGPDTEFTDGEMVYGLVKSWGSISQGIDLFTKKYKINNATITLLNTPMKHTGTIEARLNYHLAGENFINRTAQILLWYEGIDDIDDCLKIFEGVVQPLANVNDLTLQIKINDTTFMDHKDIPADIYTTDFPTDTSNRNQNVENPYPIVYGAKDLNGESNGSLYPAQWIEEGKLIVSDIPCDAIDSVWVWDSGLDRFVEIDSSDYMVTLDDSGRTTISITDINDVDLWAYFYPKIIRTLGDGDIDDLGDADEVIKIGDQDLSTQLNIYTTVGPEFDNAQLDTQEKTGSGLADPSTGAGNAYFGVKTDYNSPASTNFSTGDIRFGESGDMSAAISIISLSSPSSYTEQDCGATLNTDMTWQDLADDFYFQLAFTCGAAGAIALAFEITQLRLRIKMNTNLSFSSHKVFVAGDGRTFGSWIDAGGRTPPAGQDDEGDIIKNPAYLIEDILREDLSIATADIDTASFDAAATELSGWEMAFSIVKQQNSLAMIEAICRFSKLNYVINCQGEHSLIVLDTSYSADDTLYKADIKAGGLTLQSSKIKELINDVAVNFSKHPAQNSYREQTTDTDSTSQTTYNITNEAIVNADKIIDSSTANDLSDHFAGSTDGFWADLHSIIDAKLLTFEHIDWEVGDIIQVDSGVDDVLLNGLTSWTNHLMMIIDKKINKGRELEFKMIHVYTAGGA